VFDGDTTEIRYRRLRPQGALASDGLDRFGG
jgi:hypothetical protein